MLMAAMAAVFAAAAAFAPTAASAAGAVVAAPAATPAPGGNGAATDAYDLDADVNRVLKTFDVPGMAVAIVKDGKVLVARGYGVRKLGERQAVDARTQFEVASNSKAFTAAALAMLVDEGKLAWDDPVTKHLPGFQMYDPYVTGAMTVRDLLTHRSGLGLGAGDLLWWPSTTFGTDEIIARLRHIKPATSFRESYAYDNLLYIAAGKIIAQKDGKPWGEAIGERFLAPLGMADTTTSVAAMLAGADHAAPHSRVGERTVAVRPMPVPNAAGAVGVNTGADDIARWMAMLLNDGKTADGKRLLGAGQLAEMWSAQTPMRIVEPKPALAATKARFSAYGLGFSLRDYQGRKIAMHGGALVGFYSTVLLVPEEKLGIAILTNAENREAMTALYWRILDHYLKVPPTDWIALYAAEQADARRLERARQGRARAVRAAASSPSLPLASYDGDYVDPWYGKATIAPEGGKRVLRFSRTPDLAGELEHFQYDTFIVRWTQRSLNADAYVSFALNPDGSIERMKMAPISTETDFSYDFRDLDFTPAPK